MNKKIKSIMKFFSREEILNVLKFLSGTLVVLLVAGVCIYFSREMKDFETFFNWTCSIVGTLAIVVIIVLFKEMGNKVKKKEVELSAQKHNVPAGPPKGTFRRES